METRRVLVTGGCGYIGREIVSTLQAAGHAVFGLDVSNMPIVKQETDSDSGRLPCIQADVTNSEDMAKAVHHVGDELGGLDVLICTAGVMDPEDGDIFTVSEEVWDRTFAINVKGYMISVKAALPYLLSGRTPAVVLISSLVASRGSADAQLAYTASKGAVLALGRELAVSLAYQGIRVNCVSPGPLDGGVLASRLSSVEQKERRAAMIPLGRLGSAEDVARVCAFLVSTEAGYISGAEIMVDGAASAAFMKSVNLVKQTLAIGLNA
jgi:NAD(P)-dependent dehydrogenase (short-subunit alcohol dehydrogenase family)